TGVLSPHPRVPSCRQKRTSCIFPATPLLNSLYRRQPLAFRLFSNHAGHSSSLQGEGMGWYASWQQHRGYRSSGDAQQA
ncbi:MAG: hypothetical protein ACK5O5_01160, partial [bacterium]